MQYKRPRLLFLPRNSKRWVIYFAVGIGTILLYGVSFVSSQADAAFKPVGIVLLVVAIVTFLTDKSCPR
jgi:hypothetical protein